MKKVGNLKPVPKSNKGLSKLPEEVRNRMGYMKEGGKTESFSKDDVEYAIRLSIDNLGLPGGLKEIKKLSGKYIVFVPSYFSVESVDKIVNEINNLLGSNFDIIKGSVKNVALGKRFEIQQLKMATGGGVGVYSKFDSKLLQDWRNYGGSSISVLKELERLKKTKQAYYGNRLIKYDDLINSLTENDKKIISEINKEWNFKYEYAKGGGVGELKVGDKVKHKGDNSTGIVRKITEDGHIIWTRDEDGFDEESMQRYLQKMATGGGIDEKMSYNEFVETLREYEIEGGFGKTLEKGYTMYYLPTGDRYLNTKFKHRNKRKAYSEYLKMDKYAKGGTMVYKYTPSDFIETQTGYISKDKKIKIRRISYGTYRCYDENGVELGYGTNLESAIDSLNLGLMKYAKGGTINGFIYNIGGL